METVVVERVIAAPIEQVFDWCADTTNYERSGWVLRDTLITPGRDAPWGVGAIRRHTWLVGHFHERITRYDAPHGFDYVVDRSFPPARHEGGTMTFTATPGGTRVLWTTTSEVGLPLLAGPVTRLLAKPLISRVFGQILDKCAEDLAAAG
ncbi:SRPBCC family protein [Nocardia asteroides]|uniref:SRPBCC family protein n=1 Tax=Nocardia asteroides TaxID=1824 RepID=UPI001E595AF9|nr:SRPBCC family protein [Nocardia asteroides]UGT54063.1 SRPBCC family protein [Nocardia asteroides]